MKNRQGSKREMTQSRNSDGAGAGQTPNPAIVNTEARMEREKLSQYKKYFTDQNSRDKKLLSVLNLIKEYNDIALLIVEDSTLAQEGIDYLSQIQAKAEEAKKATLEQSNKKSFMQMFSNKHKQIIVTITKKFYDTALTTPGFYTHRLLKKIVQLTTLYNSIYCGTSLSKRIIKLIQRLIDLLYLEIKTTKIINLVIDDHIIPAELKEIHATLLENESKIEELLKNYTELYEQYMNLRNPAAAGVATPTHNPKAEAKAGARTGATAQLFPPSHPHPIAAANAAQTEEEKNDAATAPALSGIFIF